MRSFITVVIMILACLLTVSTAYALTGSLGNARMVLRPNVIDGQITTIDKTLLVNNVNDIPINIQVFPDYKYSKIVTILDPSFTLQPGESKNARIQIQLKSGGNYEGRIHVTFTSADPNVGSTPIGLSSTIIILANGTITQDYYDVMNATVPENESTVISIEDLQGINTPDNGINTNPDNSATAGASSTAGSSSKGGKLNALTLLLLVVGLLVLVAIILVILGIIKKLRVN